MSNRAVFLDRDGTINVEVNYLNDPRHLQLMPGAADAIRLLRNAGFLTIVVANQSAVARGLCDEKTIDEIHLTLQNELMKQGTRVDALYYCPHHPTIGPPEYRRNCSCRKPRPGMLVQACVDFGIDLAKSYLVGDKLSDIEAGKRVGCRSVLVLTGHGREEVNRLDGYSPVKPDHIAASLAEAASWILSVSTLGPARVHTGLQQEVLVMGKLNLGCGNDYRDGYINIDIRTTVETDMCCSVDRLPLPDCHADHILARNILEHFGRLEGQNVLKEWIRVLKPQCEIEIITPDLEAICARYVQGDLGTEALVELLCGTQDCPENTRKAGFDLRSIAALMERSSLEVLDVRSDGGAALIARGRKP